MGEEVTDCGLWVDQESAIISARNYDLSWFTPEFLLTEVGREGWTCSRSTRALDEIEIDIGPIEWRITEQHLWITWHPNCSLQESLEPTPPAEGPEDGPEEGRFISDVATDFLQAAPYWPYRQFWYFWRLSALNPTPEQWILNKFAPADWLTGFQVTSVRPILNLHTDDGLRLQVNIHGGTRQQPSESAVIFDCHLSQPADNMSVGDITRAAALRDEWLSTAGQAIAHLVEGGKRP